MVTNCRAAVDRSVDETRHALWFSGATGTALKYEKRLFCPTGASKGVLAPNVLFCELDDAGNFLCALNKAGIPF